MIVRGIDAEGDWLYGKGRNDYLKNNDAIGQSILTRLKSFLGDCFFANSAGLDWFNLLGSKNQAALELAVRSTILNTSGVVQLNELSIILDSSRRLTMTYSVDTVYTQLNTSDVITAESVFILTESGDVLTTEDGSAIAGG